ncbi:MAG: ATP-binding cassette domain-containing protein [Oscillospiraceae bacterium]|nr:ATP-binding cassette domain-containing protein [Oscillospiraceae bacterium]
MPADFFVNIFDGERKDFSVNLASFGKEAVTFGRGTENDIVLTTNLVSKRHGFFRWENDTWIVYDNNSTNGIFWNSSRVARKRLVDGDKLIIGYEQTSYRVAFICSQGGNNDKYEHFALMGRQFITIGRDMNCEISVNHTAVFKQHCRVFFNGMYYCIQPLLKEAAVQFNGAPLQGIAPLSEMDRFLIGDTLFIYQNGVLHYMKKEGGLGFEVSHLSKIVGKGSKTKRINTDINLTVNAGEFVAIIGGSGAGKSTLMNCLCGSSEISEGNVYVNGEDLATNYNSLKQMIGHVPQQDIVYDNLKLERMLYYTAKLRMPQDSTEEEIEARIADALNMVELGDKRDVMIKSLSGGQKKRASIAVELLSDPKLFFLDEPTSGLDPGTERNLMMTLKNMTKSGRTVVLVTHTPLNLHLCDKIIIMGYGGRLCYCGSPHGAQQFFNVNNLVDIYNMVNNDADRWAALWEQRTMANQAPVPQANQGGSIVVRPNPVRQFGILVRRYIELQLNDFKTVAIKLLLAPIMAFIVYIVFRNGEMRINYSTVMKTLYNEFSDTQKMLFTLSCCAFFLGLFNTVQEICKEQDIYRRERMANLQIIPYVGSKIFVTAILDFVQAFILIAAISVMLGLPEVEGAPFIEMLITTYLTMLSASCLGLMVSALVGNPDQAITTSTIILIPQILFSSVIVGLKGITEYISYFISCRHACVSFCSLAKINGRPLAIGEILISEEYKGNSLYDKSVFGGWGWLILLCGLFLVLSLLFLKRKKYK